MTRKTAWIAWTTEIPYVAAWNHRQSCIWGIFWDGIINRSVTNIGVCPSVSEDDEVSIETYLFGVDRDLYGLNMKLGFIQRLRDEKKFESVDSLREQIEADCLCALKLFDRMSL